MSWNTRQQIETLMDEIINGSLVDSTKWIRKKIPINSPAELALGYVIGYLETHLLNEYSSLENKNLSAHEKEIAQFEIRGMISKRMPELLAIAHKEFPEMSFCQNNLFNKQNLIAKLTDFFEGSLFQRNLNFTYLLDPEKQDLEKFETNWQSYVLAFLSKSGVTSKDSLLIRHWKITDKMGFPKTDALPQKSINALKCFCGDKDWTGSHYQKTYCSPNGKCPTKSQTEFDAVLKDINGNWLAVFEYEDEYENCCEELSNMIKLAYWLQKSQTSKPVFCLFFWLPNDKLTYYQKSKVCLDSYLKFLINCVTNDVFEDFLLILQRGADESGKFVITETKVIHIDNSCNLASLQKQIESQAHAPNQP